MRRRLAQYGSVYEVLAVDDEWAMVKLRPLANNYMSVKTATDRARDIVRTVAQGSSVCIRYLEWSLEPFQPC